MNCEFCGRTLDEDDIEYCDGCGGQFCARCIDPDVHHCGEGDGGADAL